MPAMHVNIGSAIAIEWLQFDTESDTKEVRLN